MKPDFKNYRMTESITETGEPCVIASESWERELMTPNLDRVNTPLSKKVWRYMSFEHLATCLRLQKLFYPRVDLLGDPLEGSFSEEFVERVPADFSEERKLRLITSAREINQGVLQRLFYVSCWHINDAESEMHWHRYGKRYAESVAVSSSVGRLCTILPKKQSIAGIGFIPCTFAGEVTYINHSVPQSVPADQLSLFYKAEHFKNDVEFRSIIRLWSLGFSQHDNKNLPNGIEVDIAPAAIFDKIVVAANSGNLITKVEELLRETGFKIHLEESSLNRQPKW